jgi:hypothetical protein
MFFEGKTREKYISIAPVVDFKEFSEQGKIEGYSEQSWLDFLKDIKANRITDILYMPEKPPLGASVVFLDRICSLDPRLVKERLARTMCKRILSLSQIGFYFF